MKNLLCLLFLVLVSVTLFAPSFPMLMLAYDPLPDDALVTWKAQDLYRTLNRAVMERGYRECIIQGTKVTWCNTFARDTLDARNTTWVGQGFRFNSLAADISPVFPKPEDVVRFNIAAAWSRADKAWRSGKLTRLSPQEAQEEANRGGYVWIVSKKWRHEALVCPDTQPYNPDKGPLIAQAGGKGWNGIMYITAVGAFGWRYTPDTDHIRYYKFETIKSL